jgi:hypothetical protein
VIDQNVSHHTRGDCEEMRAVVPRNTLRIDQAQIRFVDKGCRLEAMSPALARHASLCDLVQLTFDERH